METTTLTCLVDVRCVPVQITVPASAVRSETALRDWLTTYPRILEMEVARAVAGTVNMCLDINPIETPEQMLEYSTIAIRPDDSRRLTSSPSGSEASP